jgi:hypothetical protein
MTIVKVLAIAALLVGGVSVALAQSGPPSGGQPAVAGRPPAAPPASGPPGPGVNPAPKIEQSAAPTPSGTRTATRHHKKMYMSAKAAPAASLAYCQTEQQVKAPCACGPAKIACPPGMYCHAFGNACTP